MNLTAKAAVLALIALMTFSAGITSAYADNHHGNQFSGDDSDGDDDDDGRKKPKFQTKFFSEE